ncbi:MAG: alpha/beta hydrolase [Bacteroidia bacterium]
MKWWYILGSLVGIYAIVVVFLNLFLDRVLFLPEKLAQDYAFTFEQPFEELWLSQGERRINALWFKSDGLPKGLVLYFHGNADNLQRWGEYVVDLTRLGYEVLAVDYPGYGKSPGKASEEDLFASAEMAWEWGSARFATDSIVIYGRSLGCGPATYLSAQEAAKVLILETPFYSVPDVLRKRFPIGIWWNEEYEFPNFRHMEDSKNEVFIFQGTSDYVVPFRSAVKLKPLLANEQNFIVIEGGTHHNLSKYALYHERLAEILR